MAAFFGMQSQPQIDVIEDMASSFLASASSFLAICDADIRL